MDDDFFDEDLSPEPEALEGQTRWQHIQKHPYFKRGLILGAAFLILVILIVISGVVLISIVTATAGDDSNSQYEGSSVYTSDYYNEYSSNEEPTPQKSPAKSPASTPNPSPIMSPSPIPDCVSNYGVEEEGWSYGILVDLGSSGSRISIFEWKDGEPVQPAPQNGPPYFYRKVVPGVSSYEDPNEAANSLRSLLNYAEESLLCVQADLSETPIFLYATAGLRLVPEEQSQATLQSIRNLITDDYPFRFDDPSWCRIITGTEEATFDWLSVQQIRLLNEDSIDMKYQSLKQRIREVFVDETAGVIDMGGGSVEVAFNPEELDDNIDESTFVEVFFDEEEYDIYGYSYLGYGHNSAREAAELLMISENGNRSNMSAPNPCFLDGYSAQVILNNETWFMYGTGDGQECYRYNQLLFNDEATCNWSSCSFNGTYQPPTEGKSYVALDGLARVIEFFNLSDTPILLDIFAQAGIFCALSYEDAVREYGNRPVDSLTLPEFCWEGMYAYTFLTSGLHFTETSTQIMFVDQYFGIEVSWALGAMTYEVSSVLSK